MRKAAEDVAEWTCEGSLKSAGRVWLTGIPPLSRERVCLHTTEWTFLYVNLGGTAEVTGFCPMIRLYHRMKAFFCCRQYRAIGLRCFSEILLPDFVAAPCNTQSIAAEPRRISTQNLLANRSPLNRVVMPISVFPDSLKVPKCAFRDFFATGKTSATVG